MVVSLARDAGKISDSQVNELISRTRNGDMTLVLEAYENDIRHPIKSALQGIFN